MYSRDNINKSGNGTTRKYEVNKVVNSIKIWTEDHNFTKDISQINIACDTFHPYFGSSI